MIKRLASVWHARNLEFLRDRATMIFTLLLPIGLVVGMSFVFGGPERPLFKVGVIAPRIDRQAHPFLRERYVEFVPIASEADGLRKVTHQQIDLLLDLHASNPHETSHGPATDALAPSGPATDELTPSGLTANDPATDALAPSGPTANGPATRDPAASAVASTGEPRYWVNTDSPKGYITEKLLLAAAPGARRQPVTGAALRYVDYLFPGILGMNMMFSCLFGVGYVVLRYRKSGFLKRLHATPLTAFEFLTAQVLSRLCLIVFVTAVLYVGIGAIIHFHTAGSFALLLLVALAGALSMIALGLTVAARFSSEEVVGGLLNLLTWPMMLLSGIWFSLEGSPRWVQWVAGIFPLTHVLDAARAIMLDGAGVAQIAPHLVYLAVTAVVFLAFGAWSFRWRYD